MKTTTDIIYPDESYAIMECGEFSGLFPFVAFETLNVER